MRPATNMAPWEAANLLQATSKTVIVAYALLHCNKDVFDSVNII